MGSTNRENSSDFARWQNHLVESKWLEEKIGTGAEDLAVVDMRGYVKTQTSQDGGQTADYIGAWDEYTTSHIPGSVYIDWTTDIVDIHDPVPAQVADAAKINELFGRLGIGDETQIVAYDSHPSMQLATRLWWVCRYYGNHNVRVLNGGWRRWIDEGRPVSSEIPHRPRRKFTAKPQSDWVASASDVLRSLGDTGVRIVDARDDGQFTGRIIRGKRGGHIPGAIHVPREAIFGAPGELLQPAALRNVFSAAGITSDAQSDAVSDPHVIAYCNGGVAATSVLFALSILGYTHLTNYDGSWNEWNMDDSLPIEPS